jgi:cellobiose transport system substrate-binding protein
VRTARRWAATTLGLVLLVAAGCGRPADDARAQPVLTIVAERDLGFGTLLSQYTRLNPGVTVVEKTAAVPGGDLAVIDDYTAARLAAQSDGYAELSGTTGRWGRWALPIGVDGLGMCYQRHLLSAAGLPTDRVAVAKLWSTWAAYLETGQRFEAAKLPAHWVDSALSVYNAVLSQQEHGYYRADGALSVSGSDGVKSAWQVATGVSAVGESAQLRQLTPQWVAAAQSRRFATLPCPSWLLGWLKRNVPNLRGDWDITTAPGGRGSTMTYYLVVPKSGTRVREARALATWLADPAQQVAAFELNGLLPASDDQRAGAAVRRRSDPFLNGAPAGEILSASLRGRSAQPVGDRGAEVRSAVERLVTRVDGWEISATEGWALVATSYPE